jgi:hypothetical protein
MPGGQSIQTASAANAAWPATVDERRPAVDTEPVVEPRLRGRPAPRPGEETTSGSNCPSAWCGPEKTRDEQSDDFVTDELVDDPTRIDDRLTPHRIEPAEER